MVTVSEGNSPKSGGGGRGGGGERENVVSSLNKNTLTGVREERKTEREKRRQQRQGLLISFLTVMNISSSLTPLLRLDVNVLLCGRKM